MISCSSRPSRRRVEGEETSYSITGVRNQMARIGQVIPYVTKWGENYPLHIAQPYVTTEDGEQYLHALLSPGWGPIRFSDLKIGDTPFASFPDLEWETRNGEVGETRPSLVPAGRVRGRAECHGPLGRRAGDRHARRRRDPDRDRADLAGRHLGDVRERTEQRANGARSGLNTAWSARAWVGSAGRRGGQQEHPADVAGALGRGRSLRASTRSGSPG